MKESLQIARAMGWASLGLAAASAVAPHALARALGYGDRTAIVQLLGLRDLVVGAGLITANDPVPWVRARFACEVFDFALHSAGAITGAIDRPKATAIALSAAAIAASELVFFHDAIAGRPEGSTGPDSFTPMPSEP